MRLLRKAWCSALVRSFNTERNTAGREKKKGYVEADNWAMVIMLPFNSRILAGNEA